MKSQFEIKDRAIIDDILADAEYGTLALCSDNMPYSVPINFVQIDGEIYFHGSKKGKKMGIIEANAIASFSVVDSYSIMQSYFSSSDDLACPATHFYRSVSIDGTIEIVDEYEPKVATLEALMRKLQPEGRYRPMTQEIYANTINITQIYKLIPTETRGKLKLGQHLPKERFDMIVEHLTSRGSEIDLLTAKAMREYS